MGGGGSRFVQLVDELELSLTHVKTLHALQGCENDLSVKELAGVLGLSLPGASRAADALLRRGLLERREDDEDRRIKRLRLTPTGRETVERLESARLEGIEAFTTTLTDRQRDRLAGAVAAVLGERT